MGEDIVSHWNRQRVAAGRARELAVLGLLLLVAAAQLGCGPQPRPRRVSDSESLSSNETFDSGLASINKMYEFSSDDAGHQAVFYFNSWLQAQEESDWTADPLVASLPQRLREIASLRDVGRKKVAYRDTREIREALWLRDISSWALERGSADEVMQKWLADVEKTQSSQEAAALREVLLLFDWTVRNVQLVSPRKAVDLQAHPEFAAKPGPGYSQLPEDSILLGKADVWERAQVFLGLLQQRSIPAVVLATQRDGQTQPWAVGVAVGGKIYLMDPGLGLPLMAFGEGRLVTLDEFADDPQLFRSYDFGEEFRYPLDEAADLVALVPALPFSLTRAAATLQGRMTGEDRWVLSARPSETATAFTEHPSITEARLWDLPIRGDVYDMALAELVKTNTERANQQLRERFMFDEGPLSRARKLHIRGMFEKYDGGKPGALIYYRDLRQTEDAIRNLANDRELLELMRIEKDPLEPDEVFQNNVLAAQALLLASREHASYFLGLVHFEAGSFQTSANWLKRRTLDDFPQGEWKLGATYNLARAHERTGQWEEARQLLLLSESPQSHGDKLRARLIRTEIGE